MMRIEVLAGDFSGFPIVRSDRHGPVLAFQPLFDRAVSIRPTDIASFELVTEENKNSALRKAGWAGAGMVALGPVGLLAGLIAGGKKRFIVATMALKDGRKVLFKCDQDGFEALCKVAYGDGKRSREASRMRGAVIILILVAGILWLLFGQAHAASDPTRMACESPRRLFTVLFDASSRSIVAIVEEGATANEVEQIERPKSDFVERGIAPSQWSALRRLSWRPEAHRHLCGQPSLSD